MDDLISREAAIKKLKYRYPGVGVDGSKERLRFLQYIADVEAIKEVPSAEPKIIHCEECKYCRRENVTYVYADGTEQEVLDRYINCTKERYQPEVRLDDYCSRAERRADG